MRALRILMTACGVIALTCPSVVWAQKSPDQPVQKQPEKSPGGKEPEGKTSGGEKSKEPVKGKPGKPGGKGQGVKITADRENELMGFLKQHHPELADLLAQLKPMKGDEYLGALQDVERDVRRLEQLEKKSSERHAGELNLWKSRSRIRLLAAKLTMTDDAEVRGKIKDELRALRKLEREALDRELQLARQMLEKQQKQLAQLEQQATELQGDEEAWVEKKLASALEQGSASGKPGSKKNPKAPGGKGRPPLDAETKTETK